MLVTAEWYWYCSIQPAVRKVLALCLAVFSLMVVWSECTFFNENPVLSLFAIFVNLAKKNYDYFYIEVRAGFCFGCSSIYCCSPIYWILSAYNEHYWNCRDEYSCLGWTDNYHFSSLLYGWATRTGWIDKFASNPQNYSVVNDSERLFCRDGQKI